MNDREEKVRIDNSSVKTICSNIQIPPYIELLSASIKVAITENSGQPLAQIEMREILAKQRDYPTIGKWVRSTIDKGLPNNNIVFTKKDHIMKKVYLQLKMIRGLLYREISDGERKQLVLPRVYHRQVPEGLLDDDTQAVTEPILWPEQDFIGQALRLILKSVSLHVKDISSANLQLTSEHH